MSLTKEAIIVRKGSDPQTSEEFLLRASNLLGGSRVLRHNLNSYLDVHDLILQGLPGRALSHLTGHLVWLTYNVDLQKALGVSARTFQRRKHAPAKPLGLEQSNRAWKFAEILAKATEVFGGQKDAEQWLDKPAVGLDYRRPLDLLVTPAGVELVENYLQRMEFGVYS